MRIMKKRPRIDSSVLRSIAAAALGALAVVVVAGSLWAPAGAQTQQPEGTIGSKIAAIKACAEKSGITAHPPPALQYLATSLLTAPDPHPTSNGVTIGSQIAAIKACAEKSGITLNSLADLKQLTTAQRAALKQCLTSNGVTIGS